MEIMEIREIREIRLSDTLSQIQRTLRRIEAELDEIGRLHGRVSGLEQWPALLTSAWRAPVVVLARLGRFAHGR